MSLELVSDPNSGDPFTMADEDPSIDTALEDFDAVGATEIEIDGTTFEVEKAS